MTSASARRDLRRDRSVGLRRSTPTGFTAEAPRRAVRREGERAAIGDDARRARARRRRASIEAIASRRSRRADPRRRDGRRHDACFCSTALGAWIRRRAGEQGAARRRADVRSTGCTPSARAHRPTHSARGDRRRRAAGDRHAAQAARRRRRRAEHRRMSVGDARLPVRRAGAWSRVLRGAARRDRRGVHRARSAHRSVGARRRAQGADPRRGRSAFAASSTTSRSSRSCRPSGRDVALDEFLVARDELDARWDVRVGGGARARQRASLSRARHARVDRGRRRRGVGERSTRRAEGTDNQFTFTTARYHAQPLVITGPGAGPAVTAAGVNNDILRLSQA